MHCLELLQGKMRYKFSNVHNCQVASPSYGPKNKVHLKQGCYVGVLNASSQVPVRDSLSREVVNLVR